MGFTQDLWDLLLATKRETRSIADRIDIQRRKLRAQREVQLAQAFADEAKHAEESTATLDDCG